MPFNPKNIHNIVYEVNGWAGSERRCISWAEGTSYRYHVWINNSIDDFNVVDQPLYKNSQAKHREPGYFDTRTLDLDAKSNRAMFDYVVGIIKRDDLNIKAWAAYRDQQIKEAAEQAERAKLNEHAKQLFQEIRDCLDSHIYGMSLDHEDMRALLTYAPKVNDNGG